MMGDARPEADSGFGCCKILYSARPTQASAYVSLDCEVKITDVYRTNRMRSMGFMCFLPSRQPYST